MTYKERVQRRIARRLREGPIDKAAASRQRLDDRMAGREVVKALEYWQAVIGRSKDHRLKRYVLTDQDGNFLDTKRSHFPKPAGWDEVEDQKDMDEMLVAPLRFKWEPDGNGGRRKADKPVVRMSIDQTVVYANGQDNWQGMVLGVPEGMGPVKVILNRKDVLWEPGKIYGATSTTVGERWNVQLNDPRFYCEDKGFTVVSIDPPPPAPEPVVE
jgi:hypothetical protein